MRSHFSAFLRTVSNVNTRARVIYAAYFRNVAYMQHICRIFRQIPHIFPAYFAPKRPEYFKKNFRYKPVSLNSTVAPTSQTHKPAMDFPGRDVNRATSMILTAY